MRRLAGLLAAALLTAGAALIVAPVLTQAKEAPAAAPKAPSLPASIQGLNVGRENVAKTVAEDHRALYVDGVWLFSLRQGKELVGTLEIGKFKGDAPWANQDFDLSLAGQLGNSQPSVARLDGVPVYITEARGLTLAAWFRHGYMSILAIRSNYPTPKNLLRAALEASP